MPGIVAGYRPDMADKHEKITDATKEAERRDAEAKHGAPQRPSAEESAAADRKGGTDPKAAKAYDEYLDKAKDSPGEGRIP